MTQQEIQERFASAMEHKTKEEKLIFEAAQFQLEAVIAIEKAMKEENISKDFLAEIIGVKKKDLKAYWVADKFFDILMIHKICDALPNLKMF